MTLNDFDENQKEVIETIDGPVLCIAGPGAGKTTVTVNRVLYMAEHGIKPQSILALSFANTDADNAQKRYAALPGSVPGPTFSTIHAFAYRVVKEHSDEILSVLSGEDQSAMIQSIIMDKQKLSCQKGCFIGDAKTIISDISWYKMASADQKKHFKPTGVRNAAVFFEILKDYENAKKSLNQLDFDDMLLNCLDLLEDEQICRQYQEKYTHIMIDEFQDTSSVQAKILYKVAAPRNNLCVCGDEDQSIYGFRNARPDLMLNFPKKFPGCKIVKLTKNYRSEQKIVEASSNLISHNNERFEKELTCVSKKPGSVNIVKIPDFHMEEVYLVNRLKEIYEGESSYGDTAVLCRTNREVTYAAQCLATSKIPFILDGSVKSPYESIICRVMTGYLKLAYNVGTPQDLRLIANRPFRYIANATLDNCNNSETQLKIYVKNERNEKKAEAVDEFLRTLSHIRRIARKCSFSKAAEDIFNYVGLKDWILQDAHHIAKSADDNLAMYAKFMEEIGQMDSLNNYLAYIQKAISMMHLSAGEAKMREKDSVKICTMHAAKGKEWGHVFILSCNEGNIPYETEDGEDADIEEERRLFYVALTRAKKSINVIIDWKNAPSPYVEETFRKEENKDGNLKVSV